MIQIKKLISIIALLCFVFHAFGQKDEGHQIKVKLKGLKDTTITLGHYWADKTFLDTVVNVNSKGVAEFKGKKSLPGGLYLIILPDNKYLEIILADDQKFMIESDTSNLFNSVKVSGSLENELFYSSQKMLKEKRGPIEKLHKQLERKDLPADSTEILQAQLDEIEKELTKGWKDIVKNHPNTLYAKILNAMNGEEGDFFDNVDFSDSRLLRTSVIHTTVRRVMARDLNNKKPVPVIIANADKLIKKAEANEDVYRYVLMHQLEFYYSFYRIGINKVFAHLVDTYIRDNKADWLDSAHVAQITKHADDLTAGFEGKISPDLKMETLDGDSISLYNLKKKYKLIFFWKTGCGHCTDAAKKIVEFTNSANLNLDVFAVYTQQNKNAWKEFVEENKLQSWTNVWDKEGKSKYQLYYYIVSTPVLVLLDSNNKIISNRAGDESIYELLKQLEGQIEKFRLE